MTSAARLRAEGALCAVVTMAAALLVHWYRMDIGAHSDLHRQADLLLGRKRQKVALRHRRLSLTSHLRGDAWSTEDGELMASIHLAHLTPSGQLPLPPNATLILEIGANTRSTVDIDFLPFNQDVFVITFEPILDKWATLLSRNSHADRRSDLGFHHTRGLALPFAVSDSASTSTEPASAELKISGSIDGCASLLDAVSSYFSRSCTNSSGVLDRRRVPTVSLRTVLTRWLNGREVALAKIDAQGLDVALLAAAGDALSQVKALQIEVVRDRPPLKCRVQYGGDAAKLAKCNAAVSTLHGLGFEPYGTNCSVHNFHEAFGCEAQMTFVRPAGFDERLVRRFCQDDKVKTCGPGAWSPWLRKGKRVLSVSTGLIDGQGRSPPWSAASKQATYSSGKLT